MTNTTSIITISYAELESNDESVLTRIAQGFGNNDTSLGILAITDVPKFEELRSKVLRLTYQLGSETPKEVLEKLEDEKSYYSVGWSHGKERVEGDKFDTGKGSFYFNPITDHPLEDTLTRDFAIHDDDADDEKKEEFIRLAEKNGAFYASNIWPEETLPELKENVMEMGLLIRRIGTLVAKQCDDYVLSQCKEFTPGKIEHVIENSLCCKARLLHYFPVDSPTIADSGSSSKAGNESETEDVDFSGWCGWHNDHGSLTGLVPAIYFNAQGEPVPCPDPKAGLYIKSRNGQLVHAKIPTDALAFQIGGEFVYILIFDYSSFPSHERC